MRGKAPLFRKGPTNETRGYAAIFAAQPRCEFVALRKSIAFPHIDRRSRCSRILVSENEYRGLLKFRFPSFVRPSINLALVDIEICVDLLYVVVVFEGVVELHHCLGVGAL